MTAPKTDCKFHFKPKETTEEASARVAKVIRKEMIETVAEKEFPYLMQDPDLHTGICKYLDTHHPVTEDHAPDEKSLQVKARDLHSNLRAITWAHYNRCSTYGRSAPEDLLSLFPAYQQMAREAAADDNRFAVKYLGSANKKHAHGDHWKDRVAELRDATAQRG